MDWLMLATELDANDVWVQNVADGLGWGLLLWAAVAGIVLILAPLAVAQTVKRSRFWCGQAGRGVEVEFEMLGPIGLRRAVAVRRCSVFDPGCGVPCRQSCLDRKLRLPWPTSTPLRGGEP
jgi:hypothetical protein